MVDLAIVGSIAYDDVKTPFGKVESGLGGSCVYASLAASYFATSGLVGVIGEDFKADHLNYLKKYKVDLKGLSKTGKTFRWSGLYEYDMNEAKTLKTELNSFQDFKPQLPTEYKNVRYLFLGNIGPDLQMDVLNQVNKDAFVLVDTMNYWITNAKDKLLKVLKKADIILLNDGEARQLFDTPNLTKAANEALKLGPQYVIIKKGEHGALLYSRNKHFSAPGFPLETIKDPTGCGDSFAGGLIGYLAKNNSTDESSIRKGIVYGSAIASFCAEDFSTTYREKIKLSNLKERYDIFKQIRKF